MNGMGGRGGDRNFQLAIGVFSGNNRVTIRRILNVDKN